MGFADTVFYPIFSNVYNPFGKKLPTQISSYTILCVISVNVLLWMVSVDLLGCCRN